MLPNFIIAGASRSGTTSLYNYLYKHPDIYLSRLKEPLFFEYVNKVPSYEGPYARKPDDYGIILTIEDYEDLFAGVTNESAIGEGSTGYLYSDEAVSNIKMMIPHCKIILILRDPLERTFSHYRQLVMLGYEELSFDDALAMQKERKGKNWSDVYQYVDNSFYYDRVKRYLDTFGKKQVRIYLFDDLINDPLTVVKDIFLFIGVDPAFKPSIELHNRSGSPKGIILQYVISKYVGWRARGGGNNSGLILPKTFRQFIWKLLKRHFYNYSRPEISPSTRETLQNVFRDDVIKLQQLIKRDLSTWLA